MSCWMMAAGKDKDFGRGDPGGAGSIQRQRALFRGFWADVGTVASFYDANIMLARPGAPFKFYDAN